MADMAHPALLTVEPTAAGFDLRRGLASAACWLGAAALCAGIAIAALMRSGAFDGEALARAWDHIDAALLAVVLALSLVNYGLRALRWYLLTRQLTATVSIVASFGYYLTGFAFLLTPGKLGEVVRLWLLKSRHDVPYQRSLGLIVVDRVVDLVSLVALGAAGLLVHSEHRSAILGLVLVLAVPAVLLSSRRLVVGGIALAHGLTGRRWPAVFLFALGADRALRQLCRPSVLIASLLLGLAAWAAQIAGVWLVLQAVGFQGGLQQATFLYPIAMLAGAAALVPGGADAVLIGMLVLSGMAGETAFAATVLARLATWWFAMLVGFLVAPFVLARFATGEARSNRASFPGGGPL